MKYLIFLFLLFSTLFGGEYKLKYWQKNLNFFDYLVKHKIDSTKFYSKIDPNDLKYLSEIYANQPYFEDIKDGKLQSALIPIGEEMQIYLHRVDNDYKFEIVPIDYKIVKDRAVITIKNNCYSDFKEATNLGSIATYTKKIFKDTFDFKKLKKGDKIVVDYEQKSIGGIAFGEPKINAVYIKNQNRELFAFLDNNEYKVLTSGFKNIKSQKVVKTKFLKFTQPLNKMVITSKFTYKRWHPILHRYRPHLGIDLRGKIGTPIRAVADGKVIFAGWLRGYGRVTKIAHDGGFISLYAHQSRQYVKRGQRVRAGQKIGAIGSTGRSTGPHLHLGIYKHHKAINPMRYLNKRVAIGSSITYKKIVKNIENLEKTLPYNQKIVYNSLRNLIENSNKPYKWKKIDNSTNISIKARKEHVKKYKRDNIKGVT